MNPATTSSASSGEMCPGEIALRRLFENDKLFPTKAECQQIAALCAADPENGPVIAHGARHIASKLCQHAHSANRQAGILLLKELAKCGDPYALLEQARACWNEGPLKNHQHAMDLIEKVIGRPWPEWPVYVRARVALGEAFRLRGLLLLRGEKVRRNPSEALNSFKFAADKYHDGEAAWLAAQFHTRSATGDFANHAKPHAKAYEWYMNRAAQQGYVPDCSRSGQQVRP
ncbi:hypothetical protein [Aromatoleum petrolei]|uniref:Sel1 repeat family protein n=1 Tax=Aromatoleum petrolei TaxID=76116 RepID=A0ABX1MPW3_9RHOO|nr:hypothetical protein [Aromatoleum petrolei]NMF89993.1 hypothetical protein [Aromatoleum petrolei]